MKQVLQNLKTGKTEVVEIPCPRPGSNQLCIRTIKTLISPGTERMLVDFAKAGLIKKARQQPERVRKVVQKIKTDGLEPTLKAVRSRLDTPLALGYSNVGVVENLGRKVRGFRLGDRVLSNGKHAEVVCVPENLCAKVPDGVSDSTAVFGVLGAIALQGVRLANPTLGESFAVLGLGVVGLLASQIILANGCRVFGFDPDPKKIEIAKDLGIDAFVLDGNLNPVSFALEASDGHGLDGVVICAATKSNEPMHQAAQMCRKRGRVILIGVVGLNLFRDDFYDKEITFQVSFSYGPGRYDSNYESKGLDYPIGFVRWTEQRNFQAVLNLMSRGLIKTNALITKTAPLEKTPELYEELLDESGLGYVIEYQEDIDTTKESVVLNHQVCSSPKNAIIGFIGAGSFASGTLIPAFCDSGAALKSIASATGVTGYHQGRKYKFQEITTDYTTILSDPEINAVVIATRHDSHASLVLEALKAGKHVFVEKPLCLTLAELENITKIYSSFNSSPPLLMVGFNRRFSPLTQKLKKLISTQSAPMSMIMIVNAGAIPLDHWTQDPEVGGGRLIGEACHSIDLLRYLSGSEIVMKDIMNMESPAQDTFSIQLRFADGSIGAIHYFANGNKLFPKERLEVFCSGKILNLDNFRVLRGIGWKGFKKKKVLRQDKGHCAEAKAFVEAIETGGLDPIPRDEIFEVTRVCLELEEERKGRQT